MWWDSGVGGWSNFKSYSLLIANYLQMSSVIQTTNDEHLNIMYVLQTQVLYTNQQKGEENQIEF